MFRYSTVLGLFQLYSGAMCHVEFWNEEPEVAKQGKVRSGLKAECLFICYNTHIECERVTRSSS